jgi:SAM-dependent methyltransferase
MDNALNKLPFEEYILTDKSIISEIENGLKETYYSAEGVRSTYNTDFEDNFFETELGIQDIEANVFKRYNNSIRYVVPWVARHIDFKDKTLVEIGCGTGSSTAAFAHFVGSVHGYDINVHAVKGAKNRLKALGITNTVVDVVTGEQLIAQLQQNHRCGIDIVLLFAVLEHQTVKERIDTLKVCWELLNQDGLLVIVETPNLLTWFDFHTSLLPFQHLLPTEMYSRYAEFSPRGGFNQAFRQIALTTTDQLETAIVRWGRGVSYHDFELAYGKNYERHIVANGFEKEMLDWVDVCLEEELLRYYIDKTDLKIPPAFTRISLSLILQKTDTIKACDASNVPGYRYLAETGGIADRDARIRELEVSLEESRRYVSDIIHSKRWQLANAVSWPYRFMKNRILGRYCILELLLAQVPNNKI